MVVKVSFTVTKNPSVASSSNPNLDATTNLFNQYLSDGKIISGKSNATSNPNVTNDEIVFADSDSYSNYLKDIGESPLNTGYTISNNVIS